MDRKELISTIKILNDEKDLLAKIKEKPIPVVGKGSSTDDLIKGFKAIMLKLDDQKLIDDTPEDCIDFWEANLETFGSDAGSKSKTSTKSETDDQKDEKKTTPKKKPAKKKAAAKKKSDSGDEKPISNEKFMRSLLDNKTSDEDVEKAFVKRYKERGVTDLDFIRKRIKIYRKTAYE